MANHNLYKTDGEAYPKRAISHVVPGVGRSWERPFWRECECLLVKVGVSAGLPLLVKVVHEGIVEAEQTRPVIDEGHGRNVVGDNIVRDGWVVDHDRIDVVVGLV